MGMFRPEIDIDQHLKAKNMRAEIEAAAGEIRSSLALLRRHL